MIFIIFDIYGQKDQSYIKDWFLRLKASDLEIKGFATKSLLKSGGVESLVPRKDFGRIKISLEAFFKKKQNPIYVYRKHILPELLLENQKVIHFVNSQMYVRFKPFIDNETKIVFSFRGYDLNVRPETDPFWKEELKHIFQRGDAFHFLSTSLFKRAIELGVNPDKCIIIRRPVDVDFYKPNEIKENKDPNHVLLLSVGRLVWEKGHYFGLEAISILVKKYPSLRWNIIGEGIEINSLNFHAKRLGLTEHVQFLGYKSKKEIKNYLDESDIFFQPSLSEGIPNSILEAMSMGKPVIASKVGGIPEIIEDGINGYLHEVANAKSVSETLEILIPDKKLRNWIGSTNRKKAIEEFNAEHEMTKWISLYKDIQVEGIKI